MPHGPERYLRSRVNTMLAALPFTVAAVIVFLIAEWLGCDWTK